MEKVVVFDLDETIGHFSNLSGFIGAIQATSGREFPVFEALKCFPETFRPGLGPILRDLVWRKRRGEKIRVIIYTNNNGGVEWPTSIAQAMNGLLSYPLFAQVIPGFQGRGCRTSHEKSVQDLARCAGIDPKAPILFLDDSSHRQMISDNVYYVQVPVYVPSLSPDEMLNRFVRRYRVRGNPNLFKNNVLTNLVDNRFQWTRESPVGKDDQQLLYNHFQIFLD